LGELLEIDSFVLTSRQKNAPFLYYLVKIKGQERNIRHSMPEYSQRQSTIY
jgi:hypothetical protein